MTKLITVKYLTFLLGDASYAVDILAVQEIVVLQPITRVPRAAACVRGVTNLRGKVIPIVDIRGVLGLDADTARERCIIVLRTDDVRAGIVVDGVSDVVAIEDDEIVPPPQFGGDTATDVLVGLATTQGRLRLLIDVHRVLRARESDVLLAASAAH